MAENEIPLEITAETKDAEKQIEAFVKALNRATGSLDKDFKSVDSGLKNTTKATDGALKGLTSFASGLKVAFGAAVAFVAGREIINAFGRAIDAASEADQAVARLNLSLASTGEFSEEASLALQKYAEEIQSTTAISDEAVLSGLSLAKTFGVSNEEAQKLTSAAIDLSAATGKDLDSAIDTLGKSLTGQARDLKKLGPEFANLTEQQLRSGAAIELVAKRFDGFAASLTQTFGGAVSQLNNNFGDIFENFGKIITQNPVVIATINLLSKAFKELAGFFSDNQGELSTLLSKGIQALLSVIPDVVKGIRFIVDVFGVLVKVTGIVTASVFKIGDAFYETFGVIIRPIISSAVTLFEGFTFAISRLFENILSLAAAIPGAAATFSSFGVDLDGLRKKANDFTNRALRDLRTGNDKTVNSILDLRKAANAAITGGLQGLSKGVTSASEKLGNMEKVVAENVKGILQIDPAAKAAGKQVKNLTKSTEEFIDKSKVEEVKGKFEAFKGTLQSLNDEINKQTKSTLELIKIEKKKGDAAVDAIEKELKGVGLLNDQNKEIIEQYRDLINQRAKLASQKVSILDFTATDFSKAFEGGFKSGIKDISGNLFADIQDKFKKLTLGDALKFTGQVASAVASGVSTAISTFAGVMRGVISGEFLKSALSFAQEIASFPQTLLTIVRDFDTIFTDLANNLPDIISAVISKLPELFSNLVSNLGNIIKELTERMPEIIASLIDGLNKFIDLFIETAPAFAEALANGVGDIVDTLAARAPEILQAAGAALEKIVAVIFERVIPTIAKALPKIIKESLKTLTNVIKIILESLPDIITSFTSTAGEFVKAIVDAIPGIIEVFANNSDEITLALVEGLIGSSGDIIAALIDSFLVEGGLERIVGAILRSIPKIIVALVQGILRGLATGVGAIGSAIGRAFTAAFQNLSQFRFASIDELKASINGFNQKIFGFLGNLQGVFDNAFGGLGIKVQEAFGIAGTSFQEKIKTALTGNLPAIFERLKEVIPQLAEQFQNGIKNAFSSFPSKIKEALSKPIATFIEFLSNFKFPDIGEKAAGGGKKAIKALGFAEGGLVPGGFPNDTFPARLTSGELIIPKDLVSGLADFLANPRTGSSDGELNSALLAKIAGLLAQPMQVQTTAEVNGRALANIILDLSRNNARLSA